MTYDAVGTTTFDMVAYPDGQTDRTITTNPTQQAELVFSFDPAKATYTSTPTSHGFATFPSSPSDGVTAELLLDGVVAETIDYSLQAGNYNANSQCYFAHAGLYSQITAISYRSDVTTPADIDPLTGAYEYGYQRDGYRQQYLYADVAQIGFGLFSPNGQKTLGPITQFDRNKSFAYFETTEVVGHEQVGDVLENVTAYHEIVLDLSSFTVSLTNHAPTFLGATNGAVAAPEPAAWAMMIAGLGAIGLALRRRGTGALRVVTR